MHSSHNSARHAQTSRRVQDHPTWPAPWRFPDTLNPAIIGGAKLDVQESESGGKTGAGQGRSQSTEMLRTGKQINGVCTGFESQGQEPSSG